MRTTAVLLLASALCACEEASIPTPALPTTTPPPRVRRDVEIRDTFYNPVPITVTQGSRVFWTNRGVSPHTVTFDPPVSFNPGWISPQDQVNRQFNIIGEFTYHCEIHPSMKGTVRVISPTFVPTL